jgi:hypothetical protein
MSRAAKIGSFACFGVAMESAASKCANARWPLLCPRGIVHNVCVSAVVPYRSRVLSHETQTLNEDKT